MLLDPQGRRITSWAEKKTMVPPQLAELYGKLMASKFNFMPAGERHLHDVHRAVKDRFPELCDETPCCASRLVLKAPKGPSGSIEFAPRFRCKSLPPAP